MKAFFRLLIIVTAVLAAVMVSADLILSNYDADIDNGRPYRVEAQRIAHKIETGGDYSLAGYSYIINVEKLDDGFSDGDSDYLIKNINGVLYRFDYIKPSGKGNTVMIFNICFSAAALIIIGILIYIYFQIIHPFESISSYPEELAKGNLTIPLREQKSHYFGKFLWGLDLLREKLESRRLAELELQKQNKTMVLSLSHDIKTPLGVIELYAKALEKGLYRDEDKKKEIAVSINSKCEDIRKYVDDIARASGDDFLHIEVKVGEFYLSELVDSIRLFYSDKLRLLKTELIMDEFSDCILSADIDRSVEVLQNIIENAVKYGDGKRITLSFSREEDCQLITITNTGCMLPDPELPHIFDSFWRGSNSGAQTGSGLGLYICRTIMNKMNGGIFAQIIDGKMSVTAVFPMK